MTTGSIGIRRILKGVALRLFLIPKVNLTPTPNSFVLGYYIEFEKVVI
jgi:hypothetical protein